MMRLQELGIEFRTTDEGMVRQLGDARRADGTERTRVFQLEGRSAIDYEGDACRIGIASALDPADEERARRDADTIVAGLVDGSISVDVSAVPPELADAARAAAGGDAATARSMVLDGSLGAEALAGGPRTCRASWRWCANGSAPRSVSSPRTRSPARRDASSGPFPRTTSSTRSARRVFQRLGRPDAVLEVEVDPTRVDAVEQPSSVRLPLRPHDLHRLRHPGIGLGARPSEVVERAQHVVVPVVRERELEVRRLHDLARALAAEEVALEQVLLTAAPRGAHLR